MKCKDSLYRWIAGALLLCLFFQTLVHARAASITFDEGPHLAVGYATLRTGDLRLQPVHIHPPLANILAAAPLLLLPDLPDPRALPGWDIASLSAVTDAVVWQYPHPARLALAGRLPIILMTLLLGAVVFRWATDLAGARAGLLALFLYVFDPNIIAHGSLVTTDMAVTLWGTAAIYLTWRYLWGNCKGCPYGGVGAGVALGLALASKVSAASLLPVVGALCLLDGLFRWKIRLKLDVPLQRGDFRAIILCVSASLRLCVELLLPAALTLWAVYGFELRPLPGLPFPVPAATHIAIYRSLREHYNLGHPSFLLGQNSARGWWYYFPVAFVLKTPLPTLFLLLVGIANGKWQIANCKSQIALLLFPFVYGTSSLFSSVNIGYRHLLPILPFLFIWIGPIANRKLQIANRHLLFAICYLLLAICYLLFATLRLSPHYLAYFNELAGGPDGGYRRMVDSNLDWGQNLWQLREWMAARGVERVYYAHYSPARPQVYGVAADFLPPDPRATAFAPLDPAPGVYAIGATVLQGAYTPDVNTYAWFRAREPVARLGHALFIYEVPARPSPAWAAVCAGAPLAPDELRARLGRPELRVVTFDCAQAWVYPAGGGPGVYVLPPDASPPPGATFEARARTPAGRPLYDVYRLEAVGAPPLPLEVTLPDAPLRPTHYWAGGECARPGETLEWRVFWEAQDVPARPLSLMAHLVDADGALIAVMDGLGFSPEQWRRGDVIVQRYSFRVPEQTPARAYRLLIGAYWLDTMERWPVQDARGRISDQIPLSEVAVCSAE